VWGWGDRVVVEGALIKARECGVGPGRWRVGPEGFSYSFASNPRRVVRLPGNFPSTRVRDRGFLPPRAQPRPPYGSVLGFYVSNLHREGFKEHQVCQNLLGKSRVLPTSKKLCKVKKNSSPKVWHNSLAKSRSNLHQEF
jgi:hypothetical protein